MYLKFLELENFGPIDSLKFSFPFSEGKPKPVVLVGGNGAGKSVILAQIVNSLLLAKQEVFDDVEV
ncbi:MAG: AAA family ATPase, partial [Rhodospirillales bacterium]|nr:AAA family ATPase [Rhodospirillales bacterium]